MIAGEPFNPYRCFTGIFIPDALVRFPGVSAGAKFCYARLVRFAGENGRCFPSMRTLASELGITRDQARRYVRELRTAKLIRCDPRQAAPGDPDSNDVVFLWHEIFEGQQIEPEGVGAEMYRGGCKIAPTVGAEMHRGVGAKLHPQENQIEESQGREEKTRAAKGAADVLAEAHFEEFWTLYPRKSGKKPARDAFRRKVTSEEVWDRVRAAVVAQAPGMLASEPRFRPMASTWLNQERYADEADVPAQGALVPIRQPFDRHAAHEQRVTDTFQRLIAERCSR